MVSGDNLVVDLHRPRAHVAVELHPRRLLQERAEEHRGGDEVLRPRGVQLGDPAVRHLPDLRRRGQDGPARLATLRDGGAVTNRADVRDHAPPLGPLLQDRRGSVPRLDAGRLRRRADADHRVLLGRARRSRPSRSWPVSSMSPSRSFTPTGAERGARFGGVDGGRQRRRDPPGERQADARVLVHRARRLRADGRPRFRTEIGLCGNPRLPARLHVHELRGLRAGRLPGDEGLRRRVGGGLQRARAAAT